MKRRAARVDANQTKVVEHLRKAGLSVAITSALGNGFPDLVVAAKILTNVIGGTSDRVIKQYRINTVLVELKDPSQPPSKRRLSPDEKKFHESWKGQIIVATTAEEILNLFNL